MTILKSLFPEKHTLQTRLDHGVHESADELIRLQGLGVSYRSCVALEGITGVFKNGSFTAIVGPNGGGKSTLLKAILGMVPIEHGTITLSENISTNISYLPQQADIDRSFPLTVQDVVASGHCQHQGFFKRFDRGLRDKVETALQEVGMQDCIQRSLHELSGGQFQRVLFARLILQDADCILLDEPFLAVDAYTITDLMEIMLKWHKSGKTLLVVNHDMDLVLEYFPTSLLVARRVLAWGDTAKVVTPENLRRAKYISRHLESSGDKGGKDGRSKSVDDVFQEAMSQ